VARSLQNAAGMNAPLSASLGLAVLLLGGCSGSAERVVTVSPFPVIRPAGGFGPDELSTEGHSLLGYEHTYFCESKVTVRREEDPSCTDGVADCSRSLDRVVRRDLGRCAAAGERFTLDRVAMLGGGRVGGNDGYREDPLSGSCDAGFVLGRTTSHPLRVSFPDDASCTALAASFRGRVVTVDLDLVVKSPDEVELVASRASR